MGRSGGCTFSYAISRISGAGFFARRVGIAVRCGAVGKFACIAGSVAIAVRLIWVGKIRTVVAGVADTVAVTVVRAGAPDAQDHAGEAAPAEQQPKHAGHGGEGAQGQV